MIYIYKYIPHVQFFLTVLHELLIESYVIRKYIHLCTCITKKLPRISVLRKVDDIPKNSNEKVRPCSKTDLQKCKPFKI